MPFLYFAIQVQVIQLFDSCRKKRKICFVYLGADCRQPGSGFLSRITHLLLLQVFTKTCKAFVICPPGFPATVQSSDMSHHFFCQLTEIFIHGKYLLLILVLSIVIFIRIFSPEERDKHQVIDECADKKMMRIRHFMRMFR